MHPIRRTICCSLAVLALGAAEQIELKAQPFDIVTMSDGRSIEGTLVEHRTDGTVVFKPRGSEKEIVVQPGSHRGVALRRSAAQVVSEAAKAALQAGDQRRLIETLRWGLEHEAEAAVLPRAEEWLKRTPGDREVLAIAVPLLKAKPDWPALERLARAGLTADRNWHEGDELVAEALAQQGRQADLEAYAREWLGRSPTALRANLLCGAAFESTGSIRPARECFRKAWDIHKHPLGALGFARTSLATGHFAEALAAAQALSGTQLPPEAAAEARAYAGAAAAALNNTDVAKAALAGLDPAALPGPAAQAQTYALGLIAFREGRLAEATKHWRAVPTAPAQLALAIAQRREFATPDRLPAEYRPTARLLNAAVRLESGQAARALELIDQHLDGRHAFLHKVATVLSSNGTTDTVRALTVIDTPESRRWQLYGHILAGRLAEAEQLARRFPADDGYAMACRVFLAAARGDPEGARMLYEGSGGLAGAPPEFARRLAELYNTKDDQVFTEGFDWPAGEVMATGWEALVQGSGIGVRADGGRLVMDGTQAAKADDAVTRAFTLVPGARFRLARLAVDISAAAQATVGLELLDAARRNGVAIATRPGQDRLHWRALTQGSWGEWAALPYAVAGTTAVIALDFSGGRVFAADPSDPLQRIQLSEVLARAQGDWCLGVFGTAAPGAAWRAAFDELHWRLKPEK